MIAKEAELLVVKVKLKEGNSQKNGRPYSFYVANVVDTEGNVFAFNVSDSLVKEAKDAGDNLDDIRMKQMTCDVEIRPKGFDCAGTIVAWQ